MSPSKKLILQSYDGETFEVEEAVAAESQALKQMIDDDVAQNVIPLLHFSAKVLSKVIEYCKKHAEFAASADKESQIAKDALKAWDAEFVNIDKDMLFDLILAANYLYVKSLLDLTSQSVADMIRGKTPAEIRTFFNIETGCTPEEEENIRQEYQWAFQ